MAGKVCPSLIFLNVSNIDQCFENRKSMLVLSPFRIHFHRTGTAAINQQGCSSVTNRSSRGGCRGNVTQSSKSHNGLSGEFLRELHAALVGSAFRLVLIDVRQLFGAAQRPALDLFDLSGRWISAAFVMEHQEMRRHAGRVHGRDVVALGGGHSL